MMSKGSNRRGRLLASMIVGCAVLAMVPGCTPDEDLAFYSDRVYHTSMSSFVGWWKAEHAEALGVPTSTISSYWNQGSAQLDSNSAKNRYWDVSTDFCSNSPDTGPYFDFKAPCVRHDFSWRNLKKMDARHHVHYFNTSAQRKGATEQLLVDMRGHCAGRSIAIRPMCYSTANVYYLAVLAVAG